MILVTGATGHFGKLAIDFLIEKGVAPSGIAALVRDEAKAEDIAAKGVQLRKGDYDDYASLLAAFAGVEKLLLVSGNDMEKRTAQQERAVKAAKEAGVKYIVYTSFERTNETPDSPIAFVSLSHLATEKAIKETGIDYTILRNNLYMDFIPVFIGDKVLETGVFYPAGDTPLRTVLRSEMAEAAAAVLTSEGHSNKEYFISNTEATSFADVAAIISEASGKNISYTSPAQDVYKETLTNAGVPAPYIGLFAGFGEAIKQGEFNPAQSDLTKLLGRTPTDLKTYLTGVYGKQ